MVRCGALHAVYWENVAEGLWTTVVPCSALQCIVVHCGNVSESLQTIVVLYGACGASSTFCGGVYHILSPLTVMAVHDGNVTESSWTTGTQADCLGVS